MSFTFAFDVTGTFFSQAPKGFQLCGYDTGSGGVPWTEEMWAASPGAVHIDQAPDTAVLRALLDAEFDSGDTFPAGHFTSDVLDVENGAVPAGSPLIAAWAQAASNSFIEATRPGQRMPALYCSAVNVTASVNALVNGGVSSGVGLWVADWSLTASQAIAMVIAASGPFPVIGVQFNDDGDYDSDVFSAAWLETVSGPVNNQWVFGPVRSPVFWPGITTFGASWSSPAVPQPLGVEDYEIAVFKGTNQAFGAGPQLTGYPVYVPKAMTSGQGYEGHGIPQDTTVTIGIRALGVNGSHAAPWVTGTVTTGS